MARIGSRPRGVRGTDRGLALTLLLVGAVLYLVLPLLATVAFSFATVWSRSILPEGYTLEWYRVAIGNPEFGRTMARTLQAVLGAAVLSPLLVVPTLLYVHIKAPRFKPWLEFLSIVPWALPGVVLALAMIRTYVSPYNVNRPVLLVLVYVLLSLPFVFRSIDAALSAIDARALVEAAQTLGAGWLPIARRVLIPNIVSGVLSGSLLVAALAAGEFVLARLVVGSAWKTFPLYQAESQNVDGRLSSALAVIGFLLTWLISMGLILVSGRRGRRARGAPAVPMANK